MLDNAQPGIRSLFVDHTGAIQLSRDERQIDFASISKGSTERKTIALLFDRASDRHAIAEAMHELATLKRPVATRFVEIAGKPYLAGMTYLQQID